MTALYVNASHGDDQRRARLYEGQLYLYAARESTKALCQFAGELCRQAFAPLHPTEAQHSMKVEDFVRVAADVKPRFIHHPESKRLIRAVLDDLNCDLQRTYFDVPRLRTACAGDYLTSGIAYAFKPHRDTWYSPPLCQLNWWLPVFPIEAENCMAFHTQYWNRPVRNSSEEFNYQDWQVSGRQQAANQVQRDTRRQSEALEAVELEPDLRVVAEPGGLLVFSAAHLHSTVPNTTTHTRFSIDFRTVHLDDLRYERGAPNCDSRSSGTTIRDYLRATDCKPLPCDVIEHYERVTAPAEAVAAG